MPVTEKRFGFLLSGIAMLLLSSPVVSETRVLAWDELIGQAAQSYEDPYRDLTADQLARLVAAGQQRARAAEGETIDSDAFNREAATLTAEGIDIDELIQQRWIVAERRERAATAANTALDGPQVTIAGFVIPAPTDPDGTSAAYLVPERGMCSHMPPPPPNQVIRPRPADDWMLSSAYEPVWLSGRLIVNQTSKAVCVVDGIVSMRATFRMDVSGVETLADMKAAPGVNSERSSSAHTDHHVGR